MVSASAAATSSSSLPVLVLPGPRSGRPLDRVVVVLGANLPSAVVAMSSPCLSFVMSNGVGSPQASLLLRHLKIDFQRLGMMAAGSWWRQRVDPVAWDRSAPTLVRIRHPLPRE
uniref:Uncharacterized protein n=1 Tax=Oryza barthii TaxID=65489 RepID=A0A0D3HKG2_9ORYZ